MTHEEQLKAAKDFIAYNEPRVKAPYGARFEYISIAEAERRLKNQQNSIVDHLKRSQELIQQLTVAEHGRDGWQKRALAAEARAVAAERKHNVRPVGITLIYPNGSSEFLRVDSEARTKLYVKEPSAPPQAENFREAENACQGFQADAKRVDVLNERFLAKTDPNDIPF